jgi:uncharacterized protein YggE
MNNDMNKFLKYGLFLVFVVAFVLVGFGLKTFKEYYYVGADIAPVTTITFSGKGEIMAAPDTATFTFSISKDATNVKDAQKDVTQKTNVALARLKSLSIEEKNIKTIAYNVYPKYEYSNGICTQWSCPPSTSKLIGYTVTQTIEVKVEDIDAAGAVLGAMGEAGVTEISGLNFTVKDEEGKIREARQKAIADAKAKARELASDLDVDLLRIVSFSESGNYPGPIYYKGLMADGMGGAESANPDIPVGENKIVSNVSITYEIR